MCDFIVYLYTVFLIDFNIRLFRWFLCVWNQFFFIKNILDWDYEQKKISKIKVFFKFFIIIICGFGNVSIGTWDGCKRAQGLEDEFKNLMV